MTSKIKQPGPYKLAGYYNVDPRLGRYVSEQTTKSVDGVSFGASVGTKMRFVSDHVRAEDSGEFRCPKAGEWYLSGANVEAYYASKDLSTPYHIAKLVLITTEKIVHTHPLNLDAMELPKLLCKNL